MPIISPAWLTDTVNTFVVMSCTPSERDLQGGRAAFIPRKVEIPPEFVF
jgi:hypothetical protein